MNDLNHKQMNSNEIKLNANDGKTTQETQNSKIKAHYVTPELTVFGKLARKTFSAGAGSYCDSTEDWDYS